MKSLSSIAVLFCLSLALPAPSFAQEQTRDPAAEQTQDPAAEQTQDPDPEQVQDPDPEQVQEPAPEQANGALRVFLDCDRCDFDYLRREITWVNWVRNREDSQVHLLITRRSAGAGTEYELAFIGREEFEGTDFTHVYFSSQTNTDDETREGYAQVIRIGLLQYTVGTPRMEQIQIHEPSRPAGPQETPAGFTAQPTDDPWNFWVFRLGADFRGGGEERRKDKTFSGNFSANRTTEQWKIRTGINLRYSDRFYEYSDGTTTTDITENYGLSGQVVKSLGPHWGASIKGDATRSTYLNYKLRVAAAPGVEFNIYPYSESSRRQWIMRYEVGFSQVKYDEITLYDKLEEFLVDQTFVTNWDMNQPWGQSEIAVEVANYLNDFSKYHVIVSGDLELRVTRGLSLDINGSISTVRDQLYIPARDLTDEEVLLQRRALETDYRWNFSFGISYQFGSIYNNVVNPRFSGGRGGFRFRY
jgi:hypothetical protein